MYCYVCAQEGKQTPAVSICIVCGMALCMEHSIRHDVTVTQETAAGLGFQVRVLPQKLPRILCPECYEALAV